MTTPTSPRRRRSLTQRLAAAVVAVGLVSATAAAVVPASPATAASSYPSRIAQGGGLYDCTSSSAQCTTRRASTNQNDRLRMICWEEGREGAGQKKWFYVKLENGKEGFLPAPRVTATTQTSVKWCRQAGASTEINGIIAARAALGRNGATGISPDDKKTIEKLDYTDHGGDWSADCIGFAALAWNSAAKKLPRGNAIDVYWDYKAKGKINTTRNPPRGALVFTDSTDLGHVEISLGNNRSIGTTGSRDGAYSAVTAEPITYNSDYLGWTMP